MEFSADLEEMDGVADLILDEAEQIGAGERSLRAWQLIADCIRATFSDKHSWRAAYFLAALGDRSGAVRCIADANVGWKGREGEAWEFLARSILNPEDLRWSLEILLGGWAVPDDKSNFGYKHIEILTRFCDLVSDEPALSLMLKEACLAGSDIGGRAESLAAALRECVRREHFENAVSLLEAIPTSDVRADGVLEVVQGLIHANRPLAAWVGVANVAIQSVSGSVRLAAGAAIFGLKHRCDRSCTAFVEDILKDSGLRTAQEQQVVAKS